MEMALRPQSLACPRSRPALLVQPAAGVIVVGGGLPQSFLRNCRYSRSRTTRCTVASSDCPNRKSRRITSPKIKVTVFRGYAPRLTVESSTQRDHHDSEEEPIETYNGLLSTDSSEWIRNRKVESTEVDSPQNASSSSTLEEVDDMEEAELEIFEDDLLGDVLDYKSMEKMEKDEAEEEKIEVGLSKFSLEMDAMNEVKAKKDVFEVDLTGHALSNVTMGKLNAAYEPKPNNDKFEVDLPKIALRNAGVGEIDVMDKSKANEDIVVVNLPGNALSNATVGEVDVVDEAKSKEGIFLVDLPTNPLSNLTVGEVDALDEAKAKEDILEFTLSETALSNAPLEEVITIDEPNAKKDMAIVGLSGIAPNIDAMGVVEVIDEGGTGEDTIEVDLFGLSSSNAIDGEVDLIDESGSIQEAFGVDLSYNDTSSGTYGGVVASDKSEDNEVILEMYSSGISSSNTRLGRMDVGDEASAENYAHEMVLLGGDPGIAKYMAVDSAHETVAEEVNYEQQYTSVSETSMLVNDIDETQEILKRSPMPLVRDQGRDKLISSEEESILEPVVDFHKKQHEVTDFDEHNLSVVGFRKQHLSIAHFPEKERYIVGSPKQDQSIISLRNQDQSIVGYYRQNASIVSAPKQTQSIVGFNKPYQSIVSSGNQHISIVRFPEQKQSIVSFRKQDLSIVGTSKETEQVAIIGINDAWHVKEVEANKSPKNNGDTLNVMVDVDNLLQKDKEDIIEEAGDMTTSKKIDVEHILTIEDQKSTSLAEEQYLVTEEDISVGEVQVKMDEDELLHLLSEEEISQAEDEVGTIENDEQCVLDETSMSVDLGIRESEADVDPQAHQRMLQELAEKNHSLGNMLFLYPEAVKADSTIDLFLNRDLSALANEPDVLIKGAFNGWRWRPFTERLHKSELGGGWWYCKLYIPKQAYRLDFVFFNGRTVYENNGNNDFVMQIESDMDEQSFEDFLVEEKRKELERLASEEAERRRQTDDQRRREVERAADEAVRAQAKAEVGMKKNKLHTVLSLAKTSVDNLWYIEPITTGRESTIRLYYNRSLRSLARSTEIWIHGGYNNWIDGLSFSERLAQQDDKDSGWWFADVVLPQRAYVLDWVFADGTPGNARIFDNNDRQDFHAILPNNKTEVEYWMEEEQRIYTRLQQEWREREEAVKRKAELSAKMKAEMKEKTMRMFLVSQKHIVYTEPLAIRAGTTVDVLYNPSNTVLNGKPEVWFRCSFNRWMYPGGVLPPQKMVKAENGSHLKAAVNVPMDAYVMDFVFSESEEGGIYDNRNGLDYHIPVFGSIGKEPSMYIVHIAVEMAPIAKVGGLGDVVTSLSRAVQDLGNKVEVILPKHDCLNLSCVRNLHVHESFSWGGTEIRVWSGLVEDVFVYFLEPQNGMFGVGCVYGRNDDRRFGFFCHSALEFLLQRGSSPHIIHCHDWSSAPVAWLCKEHYAQSSLADARVVFTIHNLEFGAHYIGKAMKYYCDKATTVSNTYSREVSGHGAIAPHLGKFFGILNGIDPDIWDPYNDNFIPVHYTSENVVEGKRAAKKALQQKLGLQQNDVPIVGIITRLTAQKGIHLIKHAIHHILERNGQVVLLGSAPDHRIQNDFCNLANTLHGEKYGRVRMCLTYDEPLSHLIYAGSDFILVPSIFEPCGLTQLVAMRYGSIPIVRKTGGLYDTVFDVEHDKDRARARGLEPNGFSFDGADTNGVDYVLNRQA
ncbi:hypothetical protein PR202_ga27450 [Eleusine coracana subsp. coracana]|uniref:starch synthase n=1 Tax=Eleusine coracana subsp. coracana TaxID=191504 RepID=A0AAV5DGT1_ELECO|nr:hypothetical protein PR202_ga27450 [Eleusine coracana subsp. coracana]